jgi:intermediate peptidase
MDAISEAICCVVDPAECLRSNHPDSEWAQAAEKVSYDIITFISQLNTDPRIYRSLCWIMDNPVAEQLSEEQKRVGFLLKQDFVLEGVQLPEHRRQKIVQLRSRQHQLTSEYEKRVHNLPQEVARNPLELKYQELSKHINMNTLAQLRGQM